MKHRWVLAGAIAVMCNVCPVLSMAAADSTETVFIHPPLTLGAGSAAREKLAAAEVKAVDLDKSMRLLDNDNIAKQKANVAAIDKALLPVPFEPLDKAAFTIGGIAAGDTQQTVEGQYGISDKYKQSEHFTTLKYDNKDLQMRVVIRNDIADILKQPGAQRKAVRVGVDSVFLSKGEAVATGRNVRLGTLTEMLVRKYGVPDNVLRDADANVYYFIYRNPDASSILAFAVRDRKVQRIALMPPRPPYIQDKEEVASLGQLSPRDFTLMGFSLNKQFVPNQYNMWVNMISDNDSKLWMYGNYGLKVDRHQIIKKVFLVTNNAYTTRGATLGYHISSVLALYGLPNRIEKSPDDSKSDDAYYYDSPYKKGESLMFLVNRKTNQVSDVILTDFPAEDLQHPLK